MIGFTLNATVLALLWKKNVRSGSTNRIGMSFTAIHGATISSLAPLTCLVRFVIILNLKDLEIYF